MVPYLAIDLETTGLVPEAHQILQVGAVWDDGGKLEELKKINFLIQREDYSGQAYALQMNAGILKQIATGATELPILDRVQAIQFINEFVNKCVGNDKDKIFVAGKNAAGFDIPFMKWAGFCVDRFKHRVIDPGSMYYSDFGYPPSLGEINDKLGLDAVTHDALDDALNIVKVIRHKCTKTNV